MARIQDLIDNKCPNCGMVEKAEHLNICPSENRTRLLKEGVEKLADWLEKDDKTHPELAYWIPVYIMHRGTRQWTALGNMSAEVRRVAAAQDIIGWREFMEGKVAKEMATLQRYHCSVSPCRMNGDDWMKHFINHLIHLSHSQWIFRNTLHDRCQGTLRLKERKDVLAKIDKLMTVNPDDVPAMSKFLLEFDHDSLYRSPFERQVYWVSAVEAAIAAGRRVARMGASARRRAAKRRGLKPRYNMADMTQIMNTDNRPHPAAQLRQSVSSIEVELPSNKRYKPGD